jgi:hypothetical protein
MFVSWWKFNQTSNNFSILFSPAQEYDRQADKVYHTTIAPNSRTSPQHHVFAPMIGYSLFSVFHFVAKKSEKQQ